MTKKIIKKKKSKKQIPKNMWDREIRAYVVRTRSTYFCHKCRKRHGKDHRAHPGRPARHAGGDRPLRGLPGLRRRGLHDRVDVVDQRRTVYGLIEDHADRFGETGCQCGAPFA